MDASSHRFSAWIGGLSSLALAAGCLTEGERAASGECPSGERCSDETPDGLLFEGAPLADVPFGAAGGVKLTAADGVQTLTIRLPSDDDDEDPPFARAFEATVESPFSIDDVDPPRVAVRAGGEGTTQLRIVDGATGELFDRVGMTATAVAAMDLAPREHAGEDDWVVYAPGAPELVARLYARDDQRVVDEGISIDTAEGGVGVDPVAWDAAAFDGLSEGDNEIVVTTSAGDRFEQVVTAVAEIEAIEPAGPTGDLREVNPLREGESATYCFAGYVNDTVVVGLDWSFETEGPIEVEESWQGLARCPVVTAVEEGSATLVVSAGGLERTEEFEVSAAQGAQLLERVPVVEGEPATPGERARGR